MPDISTANYLGDISLKHFFLPYGVILFALAGSSAIPELRDLLSGGGRLKKIIVLGTLIPAALYGLFASGMVGIFGKLVSPDVVSSLALRYGSSMAVVGGLTGFLAIATSFAVFGLVLKHALMYDLGVPKKLSTVVVIAAPVVLLLAVTSDFIAIIGFVGAVFGGIESLLILAIHRSAQRGSGRLPEYTLAIPSTLYWCMGMLFAAGIGYEVFYTLR